MKYDRNHEGMYNKSDFEAIDFRIKVYGKGYYFVCAEGDGNFTPYLHKDGTIWDRCGTENMYYGKDAAQDVIDRAFSAYKEIFTDQDLKIEI